MVCFHCNRRSLHCILLDVNHHDLSTTSVDSVVQSVRFLFLMKVPVDKPHVPRVHITEYVICTNVEDFGHSFTLVERNLQERGQTSTRSFPPRLCLASF